MKTVSKKLDFLSCYTTAIRALEEALYTDPTARRPDNADSKAIHTAVLHMLSASAISLAKPDGIEAARRIIVRNQGNPLSDADQEFISNALTVDQAHRVIRHRAREEFENAIFEAARHQKMKKSDLIKPELYNAGGVPDTKKIRALIEPFEKQLSRWMLGVDEASKPFEGQPSRAVAGAYRPVQVVRKSALSIPIPDECYKLVVNEIEKQLGKFMPALKDDDGPGYPKAYKKIHNAVLHILSAGYLRLVDTDKSNQALTMLVEEITADARDEFCDAMLALHDESRRPAQDDATPPPVLHVFKPSLISSKERLAPIALQAEEELFKRISAAATLSPVTGNRSGRS